VRERLRKVREKLEEIKQQIHCCWLEAEDSFDAEFFGNLEDEVDEVIKLLDEVVEG